MAAEKKQSRPRSKPQDPLPAAIEGLGVFYLGQKIDADRGTPTGEPVLVDAKRFTTHAVCVGMTGSGKTGLLIGLIEEAAIDGIPTLVIDPKGDLANVLLSFPNLAPTDFLPWLEPEAAKREGISLEELADRTAKKWTEGLAASGSGGSTRRPRWRSTRPGAELADRWRCSAASMRPPPRSSTTPKPVASESSHSSRRSSRWSASSVVVKGKTPSTPNHTALSGK